MSICSGSIVPTNCLPHGELRGPKAKDPLPRAKKLFREDPARQRRSELQAARGLRRCAAQKRTTTAFVLSLRDYLGRAESFGLVPLLGVRRSCTGAHRSRSARSRLRPILQAGSLPAPPNLERRPGRAEARGIRSGDPRGSPQVREGGACARLFRKHVFPVLESLHEASDSEPTVAILHKFGGQGSIARRRLRYANLRRRH